MDKAIFISSRGARILTGLGNGQTRLALIGLLLTSTITKSIAELKTCATSKRETSINPFQRACSLNGSRQLQARPHIVERSELLSRAACAITIDLKIARSALHMARVLPRVLCHPPSAAWPGACCCIKGGTFRRRGIPPARTKPKPLTKGCHAASCDVTPEWQDLIQNLLSSMAMCVQRCAEMLHDVARV